KSRCFNELLPSGEAVHSFTTYASVRMRAPGAAQVLRFAQASRQSRRSRPVAGHIRLHSVNCCAQVLGHAAGAPARETSGSPTTNSTAASSAAALCGRAKDVPPFSLYGGARGRGNETDISQMAGHPPLLACFAFLSFCRGIAYPWADKILRGEDIRAPPPRGT